MTEVDFYVVGEINADAALRTACRITQKAWSQGLRVYLLLNTDDEAARMDDLLWTFEQDSFVPHERWYGASDSNAMANMANMVKDGVDDTVARPRAGSSTQAVPMAITSTGANTIARVLIGTTAQLPRRPDLLINLGAAVPEWFAQCPRVVEIVGAAPQRKAEGRERYRAYREQGVPLRTHEV